LNSDANRIRPSLVRYDLVVGPITDGGPGLITMRVIWSTRMPGVGSMTDRPIITIRFSSMWRRYMVVIWILNVTPCGYSYENLNRCFASLRFYRVHETQATSEWLA
jgi:hypothetical protein